MGLAERLAVDSRRVPRPTSASTSTVGLARHSSARGYETGRAIGRASSNPPGSRNVTSSIAMDRGHLRWLEQARTEAAGPAHAVRLLLSYLPGSAGARSSQEIPDPWYGDERGVRVVPPTSSQAGCASSARTSSRAELPER